MKLNRRTGISIAIVAACVLGLFLARSRSMPLAEVAPVTPEPVVDVAAPEPTAAVTQKARPAPPTPAEAAPPTEPPAGMARTELPKLGTNAKHRVWARASFGNGEDQFGKVKTEGETFPPQGFVASPDGRLLVLDTGKQRLVRYSPDGQLEKSIALPKDTLVMPADVAIAKDGTIAVIDYPGLQTKGTVLLDAEGNRKAELPQLPDTVRGLYAAGNDFYVDTDGLSSVKLGNTQGLPDADAPGLPQDDSGRIPGQVAPDGVTVLRLNAENLSAGEFSISAMRGSPAQEVFTHFYKYPGLSSIPFLQADPAGRIYMVINWPGQFALVCLDGKTGNPAGMVELPFPSIDSGTQLRMFNVAPQGGLVYERPTASGVSFEWFNCFP